VERHDHVLERIDTRAPRPVFHKPFTRRAAVPQVQTGDGSAGGESVVALLLVARARCPPSGFDERYGEERSWASLFQQLVRLDKLYSMSRGCWEQSSGQALWRSKRRQHEAHGRDLCGLCLWEGLGGRLERAGWRDGLGRERARACVCTSLEQKKRRQRGGEAETGERRRS
jgi:hypothetical protein